MGVALKASVIGYRIFVYGQLIQATKSYPDLSIFKSISSELIGTIISAITIILIPVLISTFIGAKRK